MSFFYWNTQKPVQCVKTEIDVKNEAVLKDCLSFAKAKNDKDWLAAKVLMKQHAINLEIDFIRITKLCIHKYSNEITNNHFVGSKLTLRHLEYIMNYNLFTDQLSDLISLREKFLTGLESKNDTANNGD